MWALYFGYKNMCNFQGLDMSMPNIDYLAVLQWRKTLHPLASRSNIPPAAPTRGLCGRSGDGSSHHHYFFYNFIFSYHDFPTIIYINTKTI